MSFDLDDAELIEEPGDDRMFVFTGLRDQQLRQLQEAPGGDHFGVFIAEGDVVIERALAAGHRLRSVIVEHSRSRPLEFDPGDSPVYRMGPEVIYEIAEHRRYRGSMACFERPGSDDHESALAGATTVLVTEGVNNPTNMGVMIRTAAALGIGAVLVDPTSCDPLARRSNRVSMGAIFSLPHARLPAFPDGMAVLEQAGFETVAMTLGDGATPLGDLQVDAGKRIALILGAEGPGLTRPTQERANHRISIPMHNGIDSLNVATAAAIAMWQVTNGGSQSRL